MLCDRSCAAEVVPHSGGISGPLWTECSRVLNKRNAVCTRKHRAVPERGSGWGDLVVILLSALPATISSGSRGTGTSSGDHKLRMPSRYTAHTTSPYLPPRSHIYLPHSGATVSVRHQQNEERDAGYAVAGAVGVGGPVCLVRLVCDVLCGVCWCLRQSLPLAIAPGDTLALVPCGGSIITGQAIVLAYPKLRERLLDERPRVLAMWLVQEIDVTDFVVGRQPVMERLADDGVGMLSPSLRSPLDGTPQIG